ncbi:hypothetical protein WJX84_009684 [Apatococcus fuscideae]|uniref:HU family DNA-binding protein n=1 Tax=Apatococcus fuscideae TaxID=2026836 RepID=A0AAW1S4X1_9CHLO
MQLRRSHEPLAASVRCMATRAAVSKTDSAVSKAALIDIMVEQGAFDTKSAADTAVVAVINTIMDQVISGKTVRLVGFGSFENRSRAARKGRNPATGAELDLPASKAPAFTAGKTFKESVKAGKRTEPAPKKAALRKKKSTD